MQTSVRSNYNYIHFLNLRDPASWNSFLITVVQYLFKEFCESTWRKAAFPQRKNDAFSTMYKLEKCIMKGKQ